MSIQRVLFLGSKEIGLKVLSTLHSIDAKAIAGIITIDDTADGRSVLQRFRAFAESSGVPLEIARDRDHADHLVRIYQPDLCIVVGWYWLIRKDVLDSVPHGFVGIHNSLLPKYRGGAPLVWAIINGEKMTGCTLFSLSEGMDNGPVWGQRTIRIEEDEYISDILARAEDEAVLLIKEKYPLILSGSIQPVPQPDTGATYGTQRVPEDGRIDWSRSAREVFNFIRAQSKPYPGAFTVYQDKNLIIWTAVLLDGTNFGSPGRIAGIGKEGVDVICGDQKLVRIKTVSWGAEQDVPGSHVVQTAQTRFLLPRESTKS